jgi:hypothetical protein
MPIKSTAETRRRFLDSVKKVAETADATYKGIKNTDQPIQHKLDKNGWDGDVFNVADMGKPFDRLEHEEDVINAIKDIDNPGVVGDLIASVLQGDWLATQERAFRARHAGKIRAGLHAASRRYGHGHAGGLFNKGLVNYIKQITKVSKDIKE